MKPPPVPPESAPPVTTWAPVDLSQVGETIEEATVLTRADGVGLMYRGRTHWFQGESESHKTWLVLIAAHQELAAGGSVVYVDFEDHPATVKARLAALGVSEPVLCDPSRFAYLRPDEPFTEDARRDLTAAIGRLSPTLAILDGVSESMAMEDLDPNTTSDTARWIALLPKMIANSDSRPAVGVLDHTTKTTEGRRGWAIGSQHKKAGTDGAAYDVQAIRKVYRAYGSEPVEGIVSVRVAKDRVGYVRGHSPDDNAATLSITAWPDGGVTYEVTTAAMARDHGLRVEIARYLDGAPGASARALRGENTGKAVHTDEAVKAMVIDGHVEIRKEGSTNAHYLTDLGRETYLGGDE